MFEVKSKDAGNMCSKASWIIAVVAVLMLSLSAIFQGSFLITTFRSKRAAQFQTCKFRPVFYNKPRKTGSTSITQWIKAQYEKEGCRVFQCGKSLIENELRIIESFNRQEQYDAFACHVIIKPGTLMRIRAMLGAHMLSVTSIREPSARLASEYLQLRKILPGQVVNVTNMHEFVHNFGNPLWNYFYCEYWTPLGVASLFDVVVEFGSKNNSFGLDVLKEQIGFDVEIIPKKNVRNSGTPIHVPKEYVSEKDEFLYNTLRSVGKDLSGDYIHGQVDLSGP